MQNINYIDATVPSFEERIKELAKAIRFACGKSFEFPKELPDDIDDTRNYNDLNANMEFDVSFDKPLSLIKAQPEKKVNSKLLLSLAVIVLSLCVALGIGFAVYKNNNDISNSDVQDSVIHQTDTVDPKIVLSAPSFNTDSIVSGSIEFTVSVEENTEFYSININDTTVETVGFTADMDVVDQGKTQILRFTNVEKTADELYITLLEGVAKDAANNKSEICNSEKFSYNTVWPTMTLAPKDKDKIVKEGDTAVYLVAVADDEFLIGGSVRKSDIRMHGFVADITINKKADADYVWEITFSDIKFSNGSDTKYFEIGEGIAVDWYGNISRPHKLPLKTK